MHPALESFVIHVQNNHNQSGEFTWSAHVECSWLHGISAFGSTKESACRAAINRLAEISHNISKVLHSFDQHNVKVAKGGYGFIWKPKEEQET